MNEWEQKEGVGGGVGVGVGERETNRRILFSSQDRQECTAAAVTVPPELGSGWGKAA